MRSTAWLTHCARAPLSRTMPTTSFSSIRLCSRARSLRSSRDCRMPWKARRNRKEPRATAAHTSA
eukprot:436-Eustigmatos_ZCMA.PRE.1